jgi:hypothetical protein
VSFGLIYRRESNCKQIQIQGRSGTLEGKVPHAGETKVSDGSNVVSGRAPSAKPSTAGKRAQPVSKVGIMRLKFALSNLLFMKFAAAAAANDCDRE